MSNIDKVEAWILERRPERDVIPRDLDLIDNRVVDSLAFAEFVLHIEETSGSAIDMDNLDIDNFRTLDAIDQNYFAQGT